MYIRILDILENIFFKNPDIMNITTCMKKSMLNIISNGEL